MIDGLKERVATLLSSNVRPAQIARALGVSEGYISDLIANDGKFKERLGELVAVSMERTVAVETSYATVERDALGAMETLIPNADMRELSLALEAVNKHQMRQGAGRGNGMDSGGSLSVTIALPNHAMAAINVQVNERNEVTEVDGRCMMSLTATQFADKIREREAVSQNQDQNPLEVSNEQASHSTRQAASKRFAEIERIASCSTFDG